MLLRRFKDSVEFLSPVPNQDPQATNAPPQTNVNVPQATVPSIWPALLRSPFQSQWNDIFAAPADPADPRRGVTVENIREVYQLGSALLRISRGAAFQCT